MLTESATAHYIGKSKRGGAGADVMQLCDAAINSVSINPLDAHMMATAGKDRKVQVWDLRRVSKDKPLAMFNHGYSVSSVYFSPSGRMMASTSYDNTIRVHSCVNVAGELLSPDVWSAPHILKHNNHTRRWVTNFRAVFAPAA